MSKENKSETFDLLGLKNKSHNPFGLSKPRNGMSPFPAHKLVCAIIIAVQRLIGAMHINSLKCLPAGFPFRSGPHLLERWGFLRDGVNYSQVISREIQTSASNGAFQVSISGSNFLKSLEGKNYPEHKGV